MEARVQSGEVKGEGPVRREDRADRSVLQQITFCPVDNHAAERGVIIKVSPIV